MNFLFQTLCSYSPIILHLLLISLLSQKSVSAIPLPDNITIPAVIVFGDSIVDPGNNNGLPTIVKSNFPPYGRDFIGGRPTGRFCNGKIPPDFVVEELGIKEFLPAYLDPNLDTQDLLTGVSFASGGTGYDPLTAKATSVLSIPQQLELFKEYISKLKASVGEERTATIVSESIYIVSSSSNDIWNTYFVGPVRKAQYDVPAYASFLVRFASTLVKGIYDLGGRRIGVFGAPPLGCVPAVRTLHGGIKRECSEEHNQAAHYFNSKLSALLTSFKTKNPQGRFVYLDVYKPLDDLVHKPGAAGFEEVDNGCCGTGSIEFIKLCNSLSPFTCTNISKFVFWDSFHPTENAYRYIVTEVINKSIKDFF